MSGRNINLCVMLFIALGMAFPAPARERIKWSGLDWYVRTTTEPEGPMNNIFGGLGNNVEVLSDGALRLSVVSQNRTWYAAEVWTRKSLGYGTYTFHIRTALNQLHPDLTLGLFTYNETVWYQHREMDIEFSAWGMNTDNLNGQYVIQPYEKDGNIFMFPAADFSGPSTQQFTWLPDRVEFASWLGYGGRPLPGDSRLLSSWIFTDKKSIPRPNAPIHMNLYLFENPPSTRKSGNLTVILDSFEFSPIKK